MATTETKKLTAADYEARLTAAKTPEARAAITGEFIEGCRDGKIDLSSAPRVAANPTQPAAAAEKSTLAAFSQRIDAAKTPAEKAKITAEFEAAFHAGKIES